VDSEAVRLVGIHKELGGRAVLDGVDLAVARGEFFALLGPSGSGKSTLLKMVSGIETPDRGEVLLAGRAVTALPPYRRAVHTVFQNYALFPHLNVADNVAFPLRVAGVARAERDQRVRTALGWVRLDRFAGQRVDRLSGGERQRVALARALVDEPEVVLLDEPLSALDPHLRGQTLELLQETQARLRATYLYVTHDREEALRAAHRVGVLNNGRLEQVGTPEDLYHRPRTAFVAGFVGPINWLPTSLISDCRFQISDLTKGPVSRLGVRPEHVRLGGDGFLTAKVVQRQFAGASVSLRLAAAETTLTAELPGDGPLPAVGEEVCVGWAPERCHVFAEETP
jgi:ABC-type Fe3+/spermidine/putrescine transport system ATPase subunit